MTGRLAGKVALITGAARGQGALEARMFVAQGASVTLADILNEEGQEVVAGLPRSQYCTLDVTDERDWAAGVDATLSKYGRIDILVNNAGIYRRGGIEESTADEYMQVVRVNQLSVFMGMKAVVPAMKTHGGSIVNISSAAGLVGSANLIAYTASKWAVRGMTKTAALELAQYGIRVNSVHAGLIDTDMVRVGVGMERAASLANMVPLGRIGTIEEAANVVLFLASDESSYCTGTEIAVDGGNTAGKKYIPPKT